MTVLANTTALGTPVEIQDIEKELRQLWEKDEARTNASLMNFAVYSEQEGSLEQNSQIVNEITREHACRAILIGLDREAEPASVDAWITAHCRLEGGQKSVCCEQVSFHLKGRRKGRFRNTIFSSLQSDLPLIFWWQGDLTDVFSEGLYRRIQRLVIDSSEWSDAGQNYKSIQQAWAKGKGIVVQDLAWTRTYHYRLAVASLYDNQIALDSLQATKSIYVKSQPKHYQSALLMVAWLCDLAGWKRSQDLVSDDENNTSYRFAKKNGELVDVKIEHCDQGAPLAEFQVISDEVTVKVSRELNDDQLLHSIVTSSLTLESHGQADSDLSAELVTDQLSRGGKNSLYRRVFPTFIELL